MPSRSGWNRLKKRKRTNRGARRCKIQPRQFTAPNTTSPTQSPASAAQIRRVVIRRRLRRAKSAAVIEAVSQHDAAAARRLRPSAARISTNLSESLVSLASVICAPDSDRPDTIQCKGRVPRPQLIHAGRCNRAFRKRSRVNAKKHRREQPHRDEKPRWLRYFPSCQSKPTSIAASTYASRLHCHASFRVTV